MRKCLKATQPRPFLHPAPNPQMGAESKVDSTGTQGAPGPSFDRRDLELLQASAEGGLPLSMDAHTKCVFAHRFRRRISAD